MIAAGVLLDISRVVSTLVALARPALGARTSLIAALVRLMVRELDLARPWEFEVAARLSQIGLLAGVGRLDGVREMIARQGEPFALRCEPTPPIEQRNRIVLGGHILRVCADYVALLEADLGPDAALARLSSQPLECDPVLVGLLARCVTEGDMPDLAA